MSTNTEVRPQERPQESREPAGRTEAVATLRPAVDIYEQAQGITLRADLPGVTRERLGIRVDGHVLTIEGETAAALPEGMEPLYAELRPGRYQRSFTLSNELDAEGISAEMKDGVLTLHVPKRAEHQPRRIPVEIA